MSGTAEKTGPAISSSINEVQAIFTSNAALEDAVARLRTAGLDHADLSLPVARPSPGEATPEMSAAAPLGEDDTRQARTLGTSMAGTVGAFAAAAATVATGGAAAAAAAAAVAVGAGAAAAAHGAGDAAKTVQEQTRDEAAQRGELVLAVRVTDEQSRGMVEALLRDAGASRVTPVTRETAAVPGIDASGWTG